MAKRLWTAAFWVYLAVLLRITVFRTGWYANGFFHGDIEILPFQEIFTYLNPHQWFDFTYLFFGNIGWFLPFGAYLAWRGKSLAFGTLTGFCLSLTIEVFQFVLSSGHSSTEDLILNTLGAFLGWLIFSQIRKKFTKDL